MVIKEELFTCIHVCLHVIQHKWIKHINNNFPCIPFLQNSRRSNDFFNEAKRRKKILLLILIVSTNTINLFKIWALPVFGWFNMCIIYIFYIHQIQVQFCVVQQKKNWKMKRKSAATCTAVEGMYHMPFSNLCISTNFGIGKCEGMGGGGRGRGERGDEWRLIQSRK